MKRTSKFAIASVSLLALAACGQAQDLGQGGGTQDPTTSDNSGTGAASGPVTCAADYSFALRSASLALTGRLPSWSDLSALIAAENDSAKQKEIYEKSIDTALASKEFAAEMVRFFHNMFATGNLANQRMRTDNNGMVQYMPDQDCAATFAASIVVNDKKYTDLFTATTGTCPTFDEATGTFTDGNVLDEAGQPVAMVGVLNDPGIMKNYASNMAFRRVRFVQETFACTKFPSETGGKPTPMGSSLYTSPWPFDAITGGEGARVNFKDTSAVICANCHQSMNRIAPLFANFSLTTGLYSDQIQVRVPVQGTPAAQLKDWLPDGEGLAWRFDKPVQTLAELGTTMSADKEVAQCFVNRVWNHTFSRGDIVRELATIPTDLTAEEAKAFAADGFNVKNLIRRVLKSETYVNQKSGGAR
ncbi:MAG: hypothetical protein U0169_03575 [Polyangiaceae bacterium]